METLEIKFAINEIIQGINALDEIVQENFELLYNAAQKSGGGAVRAIPEDHWAPRRVSITHEDGSETRLHERQGLKICGGHHKFNDDGHMPIESHLVKGLDALNQLKALAEKPVVLSDEVKARLKALLD